VEDRKIRFTPILMHFAARFCGRTYAEFASDYRVLVEANLKCIDEFQSDMAWLISDPYRETSAFGANIEFVAEGVPKCLNQLIKTKDDVKSLRNPEVMVSVRTLDRIHAAQELYKLLKGSIPIIGWIEGQLAEACSLCGVENMLIYLMTDPDFVNLILDKCTITAKDFARAQIEAGCDIIGIGDAICSQIDSTLYEIFVVPRHIELFEYIHSLGAKVKLHICGDITHLIPAIAREGADIVDFDWQVNLPNAHRILGPKTILCGNINPLHIYSHHSQEVEYECNELIRVMKDIPYILSAGCEIPVGTPVENIKAMNLART
jgi:MtaA/CmuA family methyltransferase